MKRTIANHTLITVCKRHVVVTASYLIIFDRQRVTNVYSIKFHQLCRTLGQRLTGAPLDPTLFRQCGQHVVLQELTLDQEMVVIILMLVIGRWIPNSVSHDCPRESWHMFVPSLCYHASLDRATGYCAR